MLLLLTLTLLAMSHDAPAHPSGNNTGTETNFLFTLHQNSALARRVQEARSAFDRVDLSANWKRFEQALADKFKDLGIEDVPKNTRSLLLPLVDLVKTLKHEAELCDGLNMSKDERDKQKKAAENELVCLSYLPG